MAVEYEKEIAIRPISAISRLPGSGANTLAKQLSEDLNIDLFDHEIMETVAKNVPMSKSVVATLDDRIVLFRMTESALLPLRIFMTDALKTIILMRIK